MLYGVKLNGEALLIVKKGFIVGTPPFLQRGGGVEPPTKFSKRGVLTGTQILEGCCWEREG